MGCCFSGPEDASNKPEASKTIPAISDLKPSDVVAKASEAAAVKLDDVALAGKEVRRPTLQRSCQFIAFCGTWCHLIFDRFLSVVCQPNSLSGKRLPRK